MRKFFKLFLLTCLVVSSACLFGDQAAKSDFFAGRDIHLSSSEMCVYPSLDGQADKQIVVFDKKFSLDIGVNLLSSDRAVVWITTKRYVYRGAESFDYDVRAYLEGNVKVSQRRSGKSKDDEAIIEQGKSLVVHFFVSGEVYATADVQTEATADDLVSLALYKNASRASVPLTGRLRIPEDAIVPPYKNDITVIDEKFGKQLKKKLRASDYFDIGEVKEASGPVVVTGIASKSDVAPKTDVTPKTDITPDSGVTAKTDVAPKNGIRKSSATSGAKPASEEFRYPINISGLWTREPEIRTSKIADGTKIATVMGRFYLWQKKDDSGDIVEFQADNGVIFYGDSKGDFGSVDDDGNTSASGTVDAVYFTGNVVMTEGERTIRASEIYYDFVNKCSLAVKAEMRNFDVERGVPIYLRAAKLQQVSANVFQAEKIVLTTSEFYVPQLSFNANQLVMTDLRGIESRGLGVRDDSEFDLVMSEVTMKVGKTPIFYWPKLRSDLERPDIPIRRIQFENNNRFGPTVETNWYLSRLLGLKEPEGVDSSLLLDYFGDRGVGGGIVVDYVCPDYYGGVGEDRDDYFGGVSVYFIQDRGADDLGRTRKDLEPNTDMRGRFTSRHRHYLPYKWQATLETSYISDKNFLESYFRSEHNTSKAQETLLHFKRIEDFWAFSLLNKVRINDFQTEIEELPSAGLHFKGVSFWDDTLTYYSDTRISRLRNRIPSDSTVYAPEQFYTFFTSHHEVDAPMKMGTINLVPFVGGSFSVEDNLGFTREIDNSVSDSPENKALLGEAGLRMSTLFWKEDPTFKSDYWDVDGLRHVIKPHVEAVGYEGDSDVIEMRNFMNFGLSQRWQTQRGPVDKRRTLDWMRLDVDATFLSDGEDSSISPSLPNATYGPAKFIWNDPSIPIYKRLNNTAWGMVRDSINSEYLWRLNDTTVFMSDLNYDIKSGVIQQLNVGVSKYVYPDISYYLGSRYFRPVTINIPSSDVFEQGSNSVIGSVTYALNNRYTLIISEEYNLDYGHNVRSEITMLRRYHRLYYGLTLSVDESREENSVMFSIWPQGIKDLAFGNRRYASFKDGVLED